MGWVGLGWVRQSRSGAMCSVSSCAVDVGRVPRWSLVLRRLMLGVFLVYDARAWHHAFRYVDTLWPQPQPQPLRVDQEAVL